MNKTEIMEEYVNKQIADGYIDEKGAPLKCHKCESKNFKEVCYNDGAYTVEIDVTCKDCGAHVGNWAYGNWSL